MTKFEIQDELTFVRNQVQWHLDHGKDMSVLESWEKREHELHAELTEIELDEAAERVMTRGSYAQVSLDFVQPCYDIEV